MKKIFAAAAAALALTASAEANAVTLHYAFGSDAYFNPAGSPDTPVTGSFDFDTSTGQLSNVSYTSYFGTFNTGSEYNQGDDTLIYFGPFGTSNYDVYQLASALTDGGTIAITRGTHPNIPISAGGSLTAADTGAVPEPASWALMIAGFGLVGSAMRGRRAFAPTLA